MGFKGRIPAHQVDGGWLPGPTPKDLEDWCKKNCKEVKEVKEVKEEIASPSPLKNEWVKSSNKNATDKKKD